MKTLTKHSLLSIALSAALLAGPPATPADAAGGAGRERAVGEAAGGGADVEHVGPFQIDGEALDKPGEFFAATADEARRLFDDQLDVDRVFLAGLVEALGAAQHAAAHDETLGLGARGGVAAGDQELVETLFFRGAHRGKLSAAPSRSGSRRAAWRRAR